MCCSGEGGGVGDDGDLQEMDGDGDVHEMDDDGGEDGDDDGDGDVQEMDDDGDDDGDGDVQERAKVTAGRETAGEK